MAGEPPNPIPKSDDPQVPSKRSRYKFFAGVILVVVLMVSLFAGALMLQQKDSDEDATATSEEVKAGEADIYIEALDADDLTTGSVVKVGVYEESGDEPINAVQAAVKYPSDKLTFKSIKPGDAFPVQAVTDSATPGLVRFAQNVQENAEAVTGEQLIATLEFTVKQEVSPLPVSIDREFSLVVRSTDNKNILKP